MFKAISVSLLSAYKVSVPTLSKTVTECLLLSRGVFREGGVGKRGDAVPPPYLEFSRKMEFPPEFENEVCKGKKLGKYDGK